MKKYLLVIPVIILTFTLVGCSSSSEEKILKTHLMITSSHKIVLNIITRYRNIFLIKQQKSEDFWEYDKKILKPI